MMEKIGALVSIGQAELIGGGFYEPVLSALPEEDAIGQVSSFSKFLKKEFKTDAKGCWLAERVWEPQLAKTLSLAGAEYTIIDDTHLRYAGLSHGGLYGHYITEADGYPIKILPADMFLRFSIPFKPHQVTIDYLRRIKDQYGGGLTLYGDDAEKFGAWPGTYEHVYKKRWLHKFLRLLQKNSSWIKTARISDYLNASKSLGSVYIPCTSYQEMNQWSLPVDFQERFEDVINTLSKRKQLDTYIDFLRGGFWKNFFIKYPESNHIHKRAIMVSRRLRKAFSLQPSANSKKLLESAERELFKSQCNCAYWHGLFGGVYIYHLRASLYKHLLTSERILDSIEHKNKSWIEAEEVDFDCDGNKEVIVSTSKDKFIIDSAGGATLVEWSIKQKPVNIINTLARRKEIYHKDLKNISYDECRRLCFRDRFFSNLITLKDQGNFANSEYSKVKSKKQRDSHSIVFKKDGLIGNQVIGIKKHFTFYVDKDMIDVKYTLSNLSSKKVDLNFAPELNFSITEDTIEEVFSGIDQIRLEDKIEGLEIDINFSQKADKLIRYPVRTISKSEKYFNEHYQATCLLPIFKFSLNKGSSGSIVLGVSINS